MTVRVDQRKVDAFLLNHNYMHPRRRLSCGEGGLLSATKAVEPAERIAGAATSVEEGSEKRASSPRRN